MVNRDVEEQLERDLKRIKRKNDRKKGHRHHNTSRKRKRMIIDGEVFDDVEVDEELMDEIGEMVSSAVQSATANIDHALKSVFSNEHIRNAVIDGKRLKSRLKAELRPVLSGLKENMNNLKTELDELTSELKENLKEHFDSDLDGSDWEESTDYWDDYDTPSYRSYELK